MGKYLHEQVLDLLKLRHDLKGIKEPFEYSINLIKEGKIENALLIQTEIRDLLMNMISELNKITVDKIKVIGEIEPLSSRGS